MTSEQIMAARSKNARKGAAPRYRVEAKVFVLGGHDKTDQNGDPLYDDQEDQKAYQALIANALNSDGRMVIAQEQVEGIQATSKFKIYVKILHLID